MSGELYTLDELDEILREDGRSGYVGASAIDGLIAALVAGPATVAPDTWLPLIFAGRMPDAPEGTPIRRIVDTIRAHHASVVTTLAIRPREYTPMFMNHLGVVIIEDWVTGFMTGFSLDPDAWMPIILSPTRHKLRPILASNELGRSLLPELSPIELGTIQQAAHQDIPRAVLELYKATRKLRRTPKPAQTGTSRRRRQ